MILNETISQLQNGLTELKAERAKLKRALKEVNVKLCRQEGALLAVELLAKNLAQAATGGHNHAEEVTGSDPTCHDTHGMPEDFEPGKGVRVAACTGCAAKQPAQRFYPDG